MAGWQHLSLCHGSGFVRPLGESSAFCVPGPELGGGNRGPCKTQIPWDFHLWGRKQVKSLEAGGCGAEDQLEEGNLLQRASEAAPLLRPEGPAWESLPCETLPRGQAASCRKGLSPGRPGHSRRQDRALAGRVHVGTSQQEQLQGPGFAQSSGAAGALGTLEGGWSFTAHQH